MLYFGIAVMLGIVLRTIYLFKIDNKNHKFIEWRKLIEDSSYDGNQHFLN